MSDQGDKICPLCAEEMDLTDQQLKPCKCGYEICVWCWHHIMDMAEKENTVGRCPACRTRYNKEKIVGMAAKCDKVVAEMSTEKRLSSRKGKSKTADSRKQLSSVRVIQKNLVYIVGLPLSLADEDLLQGKEYFSQYGKVMKVSVSRTAAGTIQHFANDTCSVYITYSKEEEAILCIQSVHGFVLDGRPLRACFGTTKYCHAWLRNVPCTNLDCLYLHEIGSQEDSFTKDEIISAYQRSRVQQIAGAINSMQRRSGSVLPPPVEEYCSNSSASADKPISKNAATNSAPSVRGSSSPPNSNSGRSVSLPAGALWGTRASNNQHPPASVLCSNGRLDKKPQMCNPTVFSEAVESTSQVLLAPTYAGKKVVLAEESGATREKGKTETLEPVKQHAGADSRTYTSENSTIPVPPASSSVNSQLHSALPMSLKDKDKHMIPTSSTNAFDISVKPNGPGFTKDSNDTTDTKIQNVCLDMSSLSLGRHQKPQGNCIDQNEEPLPSELTEECVTSADEICISREKSDLRLDAQSKVTQVTTTEMEDELLTFNDQRHRDPEVVIEKIYSPNLSLSLHSPAQPSGYSPQLTNGGGPVRANMQLDRRTDSVSQPSRESSTNGYQENVVADLHTVGGSYYPLPDEGKRMHVERFQGEAPSENSSTNVDIGESSIISNILSLDFDPWNESLTSQNLAKLLGETDDEQGSVRVSNSRKLTGNQSRFSFAREEPTSNVSADYQPSLNNIEQSFNHYHQSFGHDFPNSRNYQLDNIGTCNGFSVANNEETVGFGNSFSHLSSNKLSVSRPQMSAPPGFSTPNRAPPPGFPSHYERMEQNIDSFHVSHLRDTSLLHNLHQTPQVGHVSNGDIEFMDPAILAVVKEFPNGLHVSSLDMSSSCPPKSNTLRNEGRLQLLLQRSLTPHQNKSFADMRDMFSPFGDACGISSRDMEQTMCNNQSPFDGISSRVLEQTLANHQSPFSQLTLPQSRNSVMSNGDWDSWNGVQSGNSLGVAELLRTENLGFNKFFTGYEESKINMPNSGNFYNRTFGM